MSYSTRTALLLRAYTFVLSQYPWPLSPHPQANSTISPTPTIESPQLPTPTILSQSTLPTSNIFYATLVILPGFLLLASLLVTRLIKTPTTRIASFALIAGVVSIVYFVAHSSGDISTLFNELCQQVTEIHSYYASVLRIAMSQPYLRWLPHAASVLEESSRWHSAYLQLCIGASLARKGWSSWVAPKQDSKIGLSDAGRTPSDPALPPNVTGKHIHSPKGKGEQRPVESVVTIFLRAIAMEEEKRRKAVMLTGYWNIIKYYTRTFWNKYGFSIKWNGIRRPAVKADVKPPYERRVKPTSNNPDQAAPAHQPDAPIPTSRSRITKPQAPHSKGKGREEPTPKRQKSQELLKEEAKKAGAPAGEHNGYKYQEIGAGGFAKVYQVTHTSKSTAFAVKKFESSEWYEQELENHQLLRILKADRQPNPCYSISMPLLGPDLERFKDSLSALNRRVSHSDMQAFARQLTEALGFLHAWNYVHCDIKLANVALVQNGNWIEDPAEAIERRLPGEAGVARLRDNQIRILDLGLMVRSEASEGAGGTPGYEPPEVILGLSWSFPRDVWSVGMSLLLLYEGYMGNIYDMSAFGGNGPRNTLCILTKGLLGPIPYNMVSHLSDEALAWCDPQGYVTPKSDSDWDYEAQIDEYYRPLATLFLHENPLDLSLYRLIRDMLMIDPSTRITMSDALKHSFLNPRSSLCAKATS